MGLASAWVLARRGWRVTVLERFEVVHSMSSHGGFTRVIRQAYHEGSDYVPLIRESEAEFLALGERVGETLLVRTGLLELGPSEHPELVAAIDVCDAMGVEHEVLDGAAASRRWPVTLPADWTTCFTPSGGYLRVRPCLEAFRREAEQAGAIVREQTAVAEILHGGAEVGVRLEDGSMLTADRVVVAAGPWVPALVPELARVLVRLRRVLAWSEPSPEHVAGLESLPVWGAFLDHGFFYGFPYNDEGCVRGGGVQARVPFDPSRPARRRAGPAGGSGCGRPQRGAVGPRSARADHRRPLPDRGRTLVASRGVHVHGDPELGLSARPTPERRTSGRGERLLRARLQVRAGDRAARRGPRHIGFGGAEGLLVGAASRRTCQHETTRVRAAREPRLQDAGGGARGRHRPWPSPRRRCPRSPCRHSS